MPIDTTTYDLSVSVNGRFTHRALSLRYLSLTGILNRSLTRLYDVDVGVIY